MKPKLVTFDCANTLIWTDWQPHTFAVRCAHMAGLELPDGAADIYMKLFVPKLPEFWRVNQTRSFENWRSFWVRQVADWLAAMNMPTDNALELHLVGEQEIFETPSNTFKLFDDAKPCLERLKSHGYKLAILSNWDHSLHRCIDAHGLTEFFDAVFASLEEGVEKPDADFFNVALRHFGVAPTDVFHVGDDPTDDLQGAQDLGISAALLDRSIKTISRPKISSLDQMEEAFSWYV
ncbi:MAG: HAD-IA family hydrolase [Armatimonadetes bacterium]|nr:HAD-IA family hydrolase [Armatimonadota bacterium]MBS1728718.1 HAD-IA family hydrolase [Armatimonadota bacterium]